MKKIFKKQYLILASLCFLVYIFLFISFFVWIIVRSDIIDLQLGRVNMLSLANDLLVFLIWLCFVLFLIFSIKKYHQKYHKFFIKC